MSQGIRMPQCLMGPMSSRETVVLLLPSHLPTLVSGRKPARPLNPALSLCSARACSASLPWRGSADFFGRGHANAASWETAGLSRVVGCWHAKGICGGLQYSVGGIASLYSETACIFINLQRLAPGGLFKLNLAQPEAPLSRDRKGRGCNSAQYAACF